VHTVACLPGAAPYDAAKWGVVGLSKALAVEFADQNIRVNVLKSGAHCHENLGRYYGAAPDVEKTMSHWRANNPDAARWRARRDCRDGGISCRRPISLRHRANIVVDGG